MITTRGAVSPMLEMLPPFAIRVAATLRLSDHLARGGRSVADLARLVDADADALLRLLRYLACLGLYRECEPGVFETTPTGHVLTERRPGGLRDWLDLDAAGGRMDLALGGLLHSIRTGEPGYPEVFGRSFWADFADARLAASFDLLMAAKSASVAVELAKLDWSAVQRLTDVGGGASGTLIEILRANEHLSGALLERPEVVDRAHSELTDAGLADRCDVIAGDFLHAVPAGSDAYLLFDVLHNWDDRTAETIMRRCAEAAGPSGRVVVVEAVPGDGDRDGLAMDLKMLVLFGGRQRTPDKFAAVAGRAGLQQATAPAILPSGFGVLTFLPEQR